MSGPESNHRGPPSRATLLVSADLDITVDGLSARLEGQGGRVVLSSDDSHRVWSSLAKASLPDSVGNVSGPRSIGRAATAMSDVGVHLDVEGPRGPVVGLGEGERSLLGRLFTGSSAVRPRSARALVPFVVDALCTPFARLRRAR